MRLIELSIHNFRGIIDQTINIFDYTLLVGANNAGGSTVIDTISLSPQEYEALEKEYQTTEQKLKIREYFETDGTSSHGESANGSIFWHSSFEEPSNTPF